MKLEILSGEFSICKVLDLKSIDWNSGFYFISKTDDEVSVVCKAENEPENLIACDGGWKGFRIQGTLDFSLIGILAKLSVILAEQNIGIFVVSTFNTDYIFVKKKKFKDALVALKNSGYELLDGSI